MSPRLQVEDTLAAASARAAGRAAASLAQLQRPEGFWWAELTADSTLESDWFVLLLWMYPPDGAAWNPPNRQQVDRAAASILARQLPGGGFPVYTGGPADVSASVKAYFALKLAGIGTDRPEMVRLRDRILALGGVQAANSYVKINLAFFGLYPRQHVPAIPPEILLLPGNIINRMSAWTRAILVPLSVLYAKTIATGQTRPAPAGFDLQELIHLHRPLGMQRGQNGSGWRNFFLSLDGLLKQVQTAQEGKTRRKALARAEDWILRHCRNSDGLAAIYPAMQYSLMALEALGHAPDSPDRLEAQRQFDRLLTDDGEDFHFQPCFSPVWDTAIAACALGALDALETDARRRAGDWLMSKEVRRLGDWSFMRPGVEPSGWYFEFANEFYPDIDDTAMVLLALKHAATGSSAALDACVERAVKWLTAMQSSDGGWAAFDADNNWKLLTHVPFADHNAMLDPTCPDVTGRALEALCAWGGTMESPAVRRGVEYLLRSQESRDGSWFGRWGVNYIYGTCHALRGLRAAGYDDHEAAVLRAGEWLRSIQNADGGWGESCASYDEGCFVEAPSTPSQTAWAILGLIAGGDTASESVHKGIEYLVETQLEDGSWAEELATGTGFPRVFYLHYHLYRHSFPLLALAEFLKTRKSDRGDQA